MHRIHLSKKDLIPTSFSLICLNSLSSIILNLISLSRIILCRMGLLFLEFGFSYLLFSMSALNMSLCPEFMSLSNILYISASACSFEWNRRYLDIRLNKQMSTLQQYLNTTCTWHSDPQLMQSKPKSQKHRLRSYLAGRISQGTTCSK